MSGLEVERPGYARARALVDRAKASLTESSDLLLQIQEERSWEDLGYETWRELAVAEFQISQRRAYQLVNHARVLRELESSDCNMLQNTPLPNARQSDELARVPEGQRAEVWAKVVDITDGKPTAQAIREATAPQVEPLWGSAAPDAMHDDDLVRCQKNHIATVAAFRGVDGCPYCNRTPGERIAFLEGVKAGKRAEAPSPRIDPFSPPLDRQTFLEQRSTREAEDHARQVSESIRRFVTYAVEALGSEPIRDQYVGIYVPPAPDTIERVPMTADNIEAAGMALLEFARLWRERREAT